MLWKYIDKSTLVQVMAWCRQATSHYLSQCWPRSMLLYGITRPQCVKSSHCNSFKDFFIFFIWRLGNHRWNLSPIIGNKRVAVTSQKWEGTRKLVPAMTARLHAGIILCVCLANERQCYIVTPSLIGWAHTLNDPWTCCLLMAWTLTVKPLIWEAPQSVGNKIVGSLGCSWSIACRRCFNYIFILDLTPESNTLHKDNCKTKLETFDFWYLVQLILEIWW